MASIPAGLFHAVGNFYIRGLEFFMTTMQRKEGLTRKESRQRDLGVRMGLESWLPLESKSVNLSM